MKKELIIQNIEEMEKLGKLIGNHVFPGFLLCLEGDLGAGKTTFTKFFGKSMGITDVINSPTFTIMKVYEGELPLYHMDVYRLSGIGEDYELEDYIYGDGVCVIEWYRNILESLPNEKLVMNIEIIDQSKRKVTIEGSGKYEQIINQIVY